MVIGINYEKQKNDVERKNIESTAKLSRAMVNIGISAGRAGFAAAKYYEAWSEAIRNDMAVANEISKYKNLKYENFLEKQQEFKVTGNKKNGTLDRRQAFKNICK